MSPLCHHTFSILHRYLSSNVRYQKLKTPGLSLAPAHKCTTPHPFHHPLTTEPHPSRTHPFEVRDPSFLYILFCSNEINKGRRYWLHTLYSTSRVHQEHASNKSNESSMRFADYCWPPLLRRLSSSQSIAPPPYI